MAQSEGPEYKPQYHKNKQKIPPLIPCLCRCGSRTTEQKSERRMSSQTDMDTPPRSPDGPCPIACIYVNRAMPSLQLSICLTIKLPTANPRSRSQSTVATVRLYHKLSSSLLGISGSFPRPQLTFFWLLSCTEKEKLRTQCHACCWVVSFCFCSWERVLKCS
jgi:hypothetical protein